MRAFTSLNHFSAPLFDAVAARAKLLLAFSALLPNDESHQFLHQNVSDLAWAYGLARQPARPGPSAPMSGFEPLFPNPKLFRALADR